VRQNPVRELTTSVSLILLVFPSRRSRLRELFCPCTRLYCRHRSAVHKIHKSVVLYNVPSTTQAVLVPVDDELEEPAPDVRGGAVREYRECTKAHGDWLYS